MIGKYQFQQRDLLLAGGVALLAFTALLVYLVLPAKKQHDSVETTYNTLSLATAGQDMTLLLTQARQREAALIAEIDKALPDTGNTQLQPHVMAELERLASEQQLTVVAMRPGTVTERAGLSAAVIDIKLSGDFFDLYDWLLRVDDELPYFAANNVQLYAPPGGVDGSRLQLNITGSVFGRTP